MMLHMGVISISGLVKNLQYGYIILPNQIVMNITSSELKLSHMLQDGTIPDRMSFGFHLGGKYCLADLDMIKNEYPEIYYGEEWEVQMRNRLAGIYLNNISGHGIVEYATRVIKEPPQHEVKNIMPLLIEKDINNLSQVPAVLSLNDSRCQSIAVAGGKGCSLALLTKLARSESSFLVPPGIVITSSAYQRHVKDHPNLKKAVLSLEHLWKFDTTQVQEECQRIEKEFEITPIGITLRESIIEEMKKVFGQNFSKQQYAVRSSSQGEDTSETSAAGQMLTVLGVSDIDKILHAVRKCWSSQFTYIAIQYKRQTSQVLNSLIAVVIQEMVPADSAGVMFTCDPLTGNPLKITITANYGLGESVVSANVEPDTIVLHKTSNNDVCLQSKTLGTKSHKILMTAGEGTQKLSVTEEELKRCCLEDSIALKLGATGIKVENAFASPRDIEWAVIEDSIYLLQARPVTTLDKESEFELIHEIDSGLQTEFEYSSAGNLGEVMPGAMSPLFLTTVNPVLDALYQVLVLDLYSSTCPKHPFSLIHLTSTHSHVLFNIINVSLRCIDEGDSWIGRASELSFIGKFLDDEIVNKGGHRYGYIKLDSSKINLLYTLLEVYKFQLKSNSVKNRIVKYNIPVEKFPSAFLLYEEISKELIKFRDGVYVLDLPTILSSTFNAHLLLFLKEKQKDFSLEKLFSDFAKIMLNCQDVESADVPLAIKDMAITIAKSDSKQAFIKMDEKEAAEWLKTNKSIIGEKYAEFLKTHGHRCFKEFDLSSVPWKNNACDLVQSLQALVSSTFELKDQKSLTLDEIIHQLGISVNFKERLYLKFLVYCGKICVRLRENGKSHLVRMVDKFRDAYCHLGRMMVTEGYIPDAELLFYLTHDDIHEMLTKKSGHLVMKAIRRQHMHPNLDKLQFATIISGVPKPMSSPSPHGESLYSMSGTPVSEGVARGPARVIHNFKEVSSIQTGDILITYSTDIGWTPYFPLLVGIATEIGGLVSHGAVVAREYGLPCVVGVEGATTHFSSGDIVEVNGTKGTLKKLDQSLMD